MLLNSSSKSKHLDVLCFEAWMHLVHSALAEYRGIGTHCEKNDLLQEGFLSLWELINDNQLPDEDFKALATTMIESRLRAVRRYQNKSRRLLPRLVAFSLSTSQHSNESQKFENIYDSLEAEIINLKPKQKSSIIQFFGLEGKKMSAEEIAEQEGASPRAIWARRQRGIKALRNNLTHQTRDF
jgi:RNA polymerase sigma factor (sigma-70 family)